MTRIAGLWPALQYVSRPFGWSTPVEHRRVARLKRPAREGRVDAADRLGRARQYGCVHAEHFLDPRPEQSGRGTFSGDVAQSEPQRSIHNLGVVEEVAADHAAGLHPGRGIEVAKVGGGVRQQCLLHLVGHSQVELQSLKLLELAPQAGVLDGQGQRVTDLTDQLRPVLLGLAGFLRLLVVVAGPLSGLWSGASTPAVPIALSMTRGLGSRHWRPQATN